jgi:Ni,Fe-hydrogenase maturation factor
MNQAQSEIFLSNIEEKIFSEKGGKIYIGGQEIKPEMVDILKTQAHNLSLSELYEIMKATVEAEAINIALIQSQNFEQVQFGKALHHVIFMFDNIMNKLKTK